MILLHISPVLAPAWAYGSMAHDVASLARAQAAAGHDVTVLTTDALAPHERLQAGDRTEDGVRVVRVRNVSGVLWTWLGRSSAGFRRALASLLAEKRPDVVHLHGVDASLGRAVAGVLPPGVPVVWTPHDADRSGLRGAQWLGRVSAVMAQSTEGQRRLATLGSERDQPLVSHVVEWGVEPVPATPGDVAFDGPRGEVLYVGRVDEGLSLVPLAAAVSALALRLVVAGGDHGGRARLERELGAAGLDASVRFDGYVAPHRLSPHLARAAAVVVADSTARRSPLVASALAHGAPVAFVSRASNHEDAHAVSVLREVADETGALRGVLDAWCGTPERATRTRIAARNAAAHYAWSACASAADVVYRAVTGDRA